MSGADLQELAKSIKELRESQRETDRRMQASRAETDRQIQASRAEADRQLQASRAATDEAIRKLSGIFTTEWGRLVESLVEPSCVSEFRNRGIEIQRSFQRAEGIAIDGRHMEIDVLLVNGTEVVAVEVKTTLKTDDVDEHESRLSRFKDSYPEYAQKIVYGGMAALRFDANSDRYAYKRGMFVLKPGQGLTQIINDEAFVPRKY